VLGAVMQKLKWPKISIICMLTGIGCLGVSLHLIGHDSSAYEIYQRIALLASVLLPLPFATGVALAFKPNNNVKPPKPILKKLLLIISFTVFLMCFYLCYVFFSTTFSTLNHIKYEGNTSLSLKTALITAIPWIMLVGLVYAFQLKTNLGPYFNFLNRASLGLLLTASSVTLIVLYWSLTGLIVWRN
jgi:hypothetical protein